MDKRLFTITCTTCQARLVVRSEAAIGAILECPRCESMVHIMPPPGWEPTPPPVHVPANVTPVVPPPLDRVAEVPLRLESESAESSLLARLLGERWLVWSIVPLAALSTTGLLLWLLLAQSKAEPATRSSASAPAVGGHVAAQTKPAEPKPSPTNAPGPSSVAAAPGPAVGKPSAAPERHAETVAKREAVQPPPSTPPSRPSDTKSPDNDPFSAVEASDNPAKQAEQIEIKKAPPVHVDLANRLADPIAELELNNIPLAKGVELLASLGALPVTLDADAMARLGVTPRDRISLQVRGTTLGKALQTAVAGRGLAVTAENGQILVGPPAEYRETLRKVRYTVSDLTGDDKAALAELATIVRRLVAPESWRASGGRGTIEADGGALLVFQSADVHRQVLVFCEKLRIARHKPLRSREEPEHFTLATRWDQARGTLDRPVTANFHEPAPLAKILAFLAEATGTDILVDRAALATAETSDRAEATVTAKQQALGTVLADLLRPLGLVYRVIGPTAIQVTTAEAAAERLEIEFYPVGGWLAKGTSGPHLAERLKARIAATTWSDVGGSGEVYFDSPSQCLIVLQSQPAQVAIEALLAAGPQR